MNKKLPNGFEYVIPKRYPRITFDTKFNRFYLSTAAMEVCNVRKGSKVSIAYNSVTKQVLFDTSGNSFFVNDGSYIVSAPFSEKVRGRRSLNSSIHYEYNDDMSTDRFIVFDEVSD